MAMDETRLQHWFLTKSEKWLGTFGETFWARLFYASGIHYIPLCKIEDGGAPMMRARHENIVLPDFDAITEGWTAYVECKAKTRSIIYRKTQSERHGIDRHSWQAYGKAAAMGKKHCAIALLELYRDGDSPRWSGAALIETLQRLGPPYEGTSTQSNMVYWARSRFVELDSFSAETLLAIGQDKHWPNYKEEFTNVFLGRVRQTELF